MMKEIKVVGQPFFLLKIIERLRSLKEPVSITVLEILDFGRFAPAPTAQSDGDFVKKWRLEVIVPDSAQQGVLQIIRDCAHGESSAVTQIFLSEIKDLSHPYEPSELDAGRKTKSRLDLQSSDQ
jgi:nitrogen regulatory protein PII